jgi:sugar/nucleoside kinase (ribokinase family)
VSAARLDILGIGTLAVDDLLYVASYPPADSKRQVLRTARQFGGLIGTGLAAAARLGARCGYGGVLGGDDLSRAVRAAMERLGIEMTRLVERDGAGPVHSVIVVAEAAGTRNIFFDLAPMQGLGAEEVTPELIGSARVLFVDQFGMEGKLAACHLARKIGVPVVADLEWTQSSQLDEFLGLIDHAIVPRHFAAEVTGTADPREAVRSLHLRNPRALTAVTCGADGCWFMAGSSGEARHQAARRVQVVETTGCGDVFHGAYAAALARGAAVEQRIEFATAAAAVYASRPSGWDYVPTRVECGTS